jgi:hypothetical protein
MTRRNAIKAKCFDCSGGSAQEAALCQVMDCPLWTYRIGQEPDSPTHIRRVKRLLNKGFDVCDEYREFYCGKK